MKIRFNSDDDLKKHQKFITSLQYLDLFFVRPIYESCIMIGLTRLKELMLTKVTNSKVCDGCYDLMQKNTSFNDDAISFCYRK